MLTKKRSISLLLAVAMLLCCLQGLLVSAGAENIRRCGDDLTWTLGGGTLTISGTGDMYNYTSSSHAPWFDDRDEIKRIEIGPEVTSIGDYAFRNCAITSLTIPGNVKSIGQYAFRTNQSLKELILEDGVESLGTHAFAYCSSLGTIRLTSSVKRIAERAIFDCPVLTDVYYVGTQEQWDAMTIEAGNHKFTGVIRNLATAMGTCGDSSKWDLINGTLTISGTGDMYDYTNSSPAPWFSYREKITKIKIGTGITYIGVRAFRNCAVTSLTVPGNIKSIGQYAFRTCKSLKEVTLEEGVTTVAGNAFGWCSGVETVRLPASIETLEDGVFFDCSLLADVYYAGSQAQWDAVSVGGNNDFFVNAQYHFTSGQCGDYVYWKLSGNTLTIDGEGAMYDYTDGGAPWYADAQKITAVSVGNRVTTIGDYALQDSAITTLSIHANVERIGKNAFAGCSALTSITIARGIKQVDENAFLLCDTVTEVIFQGGQAHWDAIAIGSGNEILTGDALQLYTCGQCGDDVTWAHSGNTLIISGAGDMYDYSLENPAPWSKLLCYNIIVEEGVTSVGDYAFYNNGAGNLFLASSVNVLGEKAVYYAGSGIVFIHLFGDVIPLEAGMAGDSMQVYMAVMDPSAWDQTINYGRYTQWYTIKMALTSGKTLYKINEPILPEDFSFQAWSQENRKTAYLPSEVEIGEYDNSTYGEKTVTLTVAGRSFTHTYYVTDGKTHLDMIDVDYQELIPYEFYSASTKLPVPTLTVGAHTLKSGVDFTYSYSFSNRQMVMGATESLTVTGKGVYAGYQKTFPVAVVKRNVAESTNVSFSLASSSFNGAPLETKGSIVAGSNSFEKDYDFVVTAKDNINKGTSTLRLIGTRDYCYGYVEKQQTISASNSSWVEMKGAYNGYADGTLNDEVLVTEKLMSPAPAEFYASSDYQGVGIYELYRIEGEDAVLVSSLETKLGYSSSNRFKYDFSYVYEDYYEEGGAVYILAFSWVDTYLRVHSGQLVIGIPAKVPPATEAVLWQEDYDGDFRTDYFSLYGVDGVVENIQWSSSDPAVAEVNDGVVTYKKTGTAYITATAYDTPLTVPVTVESISIGDAVFVRYREKTKEVTLTYDNIPLKQGTDYTVEVSEENGVTNVMVNGCGLFAGQLLAQFDAQTGEKIGHAHSFAYPCASQCESCDFVKESAHTLASGWKRGAEGHWHVCKLCGEKEDYAEHTYTDAETCAVCGSLNLPGDMNNDYEVTDADAVYLLRYTLFPDSYPITRNGDFNNDGSVTDADAVYLLRYTLFPESYPIQ